MSEINLSSINDKLSQLTIELKKKQDRLSEVVDTINKLGAEHKAVCEAISMISGAITAYRDVVDSNKPGTE